MSTWDERFIAMARLVATWSKDPSTKVGCVLIEPSTHAVIGVGFNGFPRGVREEMPVVTGFPNLDMKRWDRPQKYQWAEHAERNAIYNAARLGHPTEGAWAYVSWDPAESVCADCARALIQAGIKRVIGPSDGVQGRLDIDNDGGWRAGCEISAQMFKEADVVVITL